MARKTRKPQVVEATTINIPPMATNTVAKSRSWTEWAFYNLGPYHLMVVLAWLLGSLEGARTLVDLSRTAKPPTTIPLHRYAFREPKNLKGNHPHQRLKQWRDMASTEISRYCRFNNRDRYDVDMSHREECRGTHEFHVPKDVLWPRKRNHVAPNSVITYVDSDHYHNDFEEYAGNDFMFYSFAPPNLAGECDEGKYVVLPTGEIRMVVRGGGVYQHKLHDYSSEVIMMHQSGVTYIYTTQRRSYGPMHEFVYMRCDAKYRDPWGLLSRMLFVQQPRWSDMPFHVTPKQTVVRAVLNGDVEEVQCLVHNAATQISIPRPVFDAAQSQYRLRGKMEVRSVEYLLQHYDPTRFKRCVAESSILCEVLQENFVAPTLLTTFQDALDIGDGVLEPPAQDILDQPDTQGDVTFPGGPETEPPKGLIPPLVDTPNVLPAKSRANEDAAVAGRVLKVRNCKDPPPRYYQYRTEFVNLLVQGRKGFPYDPATVCDAQQKPLQVKRNQEQMNACEPQKDFKIFMKGEPMASSSDPRIITGTPTSHCQDLSGYTYSFKSDILKEAHWFMPGYDPSGIAYSVHYHAVEAESLGETILETDQSRYDGHLSPFLRSVERASYVSYFGSGVGELLDAEQGVRVKHTYGKSHTSSSERLSGSPATTDGNTMILAFVTYCYNRDKGMDPKAAYAAIGPKYGDDSLDFGSFEAYSAVCKDLGLVATGKAVLPTEPVTFLGRVFPNPLAGPESSCDTARMLRKIHLTPPGKDPKQQFYDKASGYIVTDDANPVVQALFSLACRLFPDLSKTVTYGYKAKQVLMESAWPQAQWDQYNSLVARDLGTTVPDLESGLIAMQTVAEVSELRSIFGTIAKEDDINATINYVTPLARAMGEEEESQSTRLVKRKNGAKAKAKKDRSSDDSGCSRSSGCSSPPTPSSQASSAEDAVRLSGCGNETIQLRTVSYPRR